MFVRRYTPNKWIKDGKIIAKTVDKTSMDTIVADLKTENGVLSIWKFDRADIVSIATEMTIESIENGRIREIRPMDFFKIPEDVIRRYICAETDKTKRYVEICKEEHRNIKCHNYKIAKNIIKIFIKCLNKNRKSTFENVTIDEIRNKIEEMFKLGILNEVDNWQVHYAFMKYKPKYCVTCIHDYKNKQNVGNK
jgi:hypothetical protein